MRPVFISVNGTAVPDPYGPGFSGDMGRILSNPYNDIMAAFWGAQFANKVDWQPVGYPAATLGMEKSYIAGAVEVSRLVNLWPVGRPKAGSGYSQGALVWWYYLTKMVIPPSAPDHKFLGDFKGFVFYGDPARRPGRADGNLIAGIPVPPKVDGEVTGGIAAEDDWTDEQMAAFPNLIKSVALPGDLYADAPVGESPWGNGVSEVGKAENWVYDLIVHGGFTNFLKVAEFMVDEFKMPFRTALAIIHAIVNGMVFAAAGPAAPHWQYGPYVGAMTNWVYQQLVSA